MLGILPRCFHLPTSHAKGQRRFGKPTAEVSEFGTFVVGLDLTPPEATVIDSVYGNTVALTDAGSGIGGISVSPVNPGAPEVLPGHQIGSDSIQVRTSLRASSSISSTE